MAAVTDSTDCEHTNPVCTCNTSDQERARLLREYLDVLTSHGWSDALLMPLGEEDKMPAIYDTCSLDSEQARDTLHTAEEAVEAVANGHPGFFIYAGRDEHRTEGLVFADRDLPDQWPSTPTTLRVVSGSGTGGHLTYTNAGDVQNAKGKGELDGAGGIRAENWGVALPGSIHPTGGIYHVVERREIVPLRAKDLPAELRPGTVSGPSNGDSGPVEVPTESVEGLPESFDAGPVTNEWGTTLQEVRGTSRKLDRLLTTFNPGHQYPSVSEADQATVSLLLIWGFKEVDIVNILRARRPRRKIRRTEYVWRTINRTTLTERRPIDPEVGAALVESAQENGGRPTVSDASLYEVKVVLPLMEEATVSQMVDSGLIEWREASRDSVKKRVQRALEVLAEAGIVSRHDRGPVVIWRDERLEDLILQCE